MSAVAAVTWERCRLCKSRLLKDAKGDDLVRGVCGVCKDRPEAAKLKIAKVAINGNGAAAAAAPGPRAFIESERALIRAMHGYLPAAELLRILNERMVADVGAGAVPYALEHLHREVSTLGVARQDDWTALRQLLAQARAIGLLEEITAGVLEDFAIVFQLTPGQVTHLRDVIHHAQEVRS